MAFRPFSARSTAAPDGTVTINQSRSAVAAYPFGRQTSPMRDVPALLKGFRQA